MVIQALRTPLNIRSIPRHRSRHPAALMFFVVGQRAHNDLRGWRTIPTATKTARSRRSTAPSSGLCACPAARCPLCRRSSRSGMPGSLSKAPLSDDLSNGNLPCAVTGPHQRRARARARACLELRTSPAHLPRLHPADSGGVNTPGGMLSALKSETNSRNARVLGALVVVGRLASAQTHGSGLSPLRSRRAYA